MRLVQGGWRMRFFLYSDRSRRGYAGGWSCQRRKLLAGCSLPCWINSHGREALGSACAPLTCPILASEVFPFEKIQCACLFFLGLALSPLPSTKRPSRALLFHRHHVAHHDATPQPTAVNNQLMITPSSCHLGHGRIGSYGA